MHSNKKLMATAAVEQIMRICEQLDPSVVWSVADSRLVLPDSTADNQLQGQVAVDGEFNLVIAFRPRQQGV